LDHWVVPISVNYLTRCSIAVAACANGVILKRPKKINELDIFIVHPKNPKLAY